MRIMLDGREIVVIWHAESITSGKDARIASVNQALDTINMEGLNRPTPQGVKKIHGIKIIRDATGVSLLEAKNIMERIIAECIMLTNHDSER